MITIGQGKTMKMIQVAGTNGKGSVCTYIAAMLESAGYKCGLFLSPHLQRETERIQINREEIPEKELKRLMADHPGDNLFATYTNAAVEWFKENKCDVAVMETGLGGRLDAVTRLEIDETVITRIGLDHTQLLGGTIQQIAVEKCAIVRRNGYVVASEQEPSVEKVLVTACEFAHARYLIVRDQDITKRLGSFDYEGKTALCINMLGAHQPMNAATAVRAVESLTHVGLYVDLTAIRNGLRSVRLPGRLQYFKDENMLVDGAHNPDAIRELQSTLNEDFPNQKIVLLCAAMSDKDVSLLRAIAEDKAVFTVTTKVPGKRCRTAQEMAQLFTQRKRRAIPSIRAALKYAREKAEKEGALLVVTGSLHLAGKVLDIMEEGKEKIRPAWLDD